MTIVFTCFSVITTIEGEREGEREIKRTHEPGSFVTLRKQA
jgi:hypothetical protein